MRSRRWVGFPVFLLGCLAFSSGAGAAVCYVGPYAVAANSGASWAQATALQTALVDANCFEIWVAAGVYAPTITADRTISFKIHPGVAVYGGFAGNETQREQRDPAAHSTILSGDIDGNDVGSGAVDVTAADIRGSNSYHVVLLDGTQTGNPVTGATVLDGFIITGGDATGGANDNYGGGLFCNASLNPAAECNPTLTHLVFSGNHAKVYGGAIVDWAIYGGSASPTLIDVTFRGNVVGNDAVSDTAHGGAMYNEGYGGNSSPLLINVTFAGNGGTDAATTSVRGGAIYNSGYGGISNPALVNVTFSGNLAYAGGAIFDDATGGGTCQPALINALLWGNDNLQAAGLTLGQLEVYELNGAAAKITNSIVQDGCPAGDSCGVSVRNVDPALGPLQNNGAFVPTFALGGGSVAVDTGLDSDCPPTDARGVSRPQGLHCDIGAYELVDAIFASGFEAP